MEADSQSKTFEYLHGVPSMIMEMVHLIQNLLQIGEWAASIDLKDAYLHIPVQGCFGSFCISCSMAKHTSLCAAIQFSKESPCFYQISSGHDSLIAVHEKHSAINV